MPFKGTKENVSATEFKAFNSIITVMHKILEEINLIIENTDYKASCKQQETKTRNEK